MKVTYLLWQFEGEESWWFFCGLIDLIAWTGLGYAVGCPMRNPKFWCEPNGEVEWKSSQNLHLWKLPAYHLQISWKPRVCPPQKRQVVAIFALNPEKDFAPQKPTRHGQGLPPSITEAHLRATFSKAGKVCWDTLSTLMWGKVAQPWNAM
jgi:hypothetical protein